MKEGRILRDCSFDEVREQFCKIKVTSLNGTLPDELPFRVVVNCAREGAKAILTLKDYSRAELEEQARLINCEIEIEALSLEEIYKIIVCE